MHTFCLSVKSSTQSLAADLASGLHLSQNPTCAEHYDDSRFSILAQDCCPFHLSAFQATFINISNPALSRQKEFMHSLKISQIMLSQVSHWSFFQPIMVRLFPINSCSFSCALHSEDSSEQMSHEKLQRYERLIKKKSIILWQQDLNHHTINSIINNQCNGRLAIILFYVTKLYKCVRAQTMRFCWSKPQTFIR